MRKNFRSSTLTSTLLCDKLLLTKRLIFSEEQLLKIVYASPKLERCLSNFDRLKKTLPADWVKTIKKHLDRLEASECFGDFLSLRLGKPEQLSGYKEIVYSLRVSANVRLIIELDSTQETLNFCNVVKVKGVSDYHGDKENWYIS